ncbi:MAG: TlpA disulfide reductase family protein [Anaerolineales bacterium]
MQQNQRIILYILIVIAGISWIVLSSNPAATTQVTNTPAPQAGFPAPDITAKTTTGEVYSLQDMHGQAVLVNLWATWCPPCRAEMPAIDKMYREYKDQGLVVLAVDMTSQDDPTAIAPFVKEYNLSFPILLDETGTVSLAYQLNSLPSSFFINRAGIISKVVIGGPMSEALLRTNIEEILK